jgi:hypothetical protein
MSNPLLELQQILARKASVAGRVLSVANDVARVATAGGVVEVSHDGVFDVGDRVAVKSGRAVRVQSAEDAQVFFV